MSVLICHPDVAAEMRVRMQHLGGLGTAYDRFTGVRFVAHPGCPKHPSKWVFPKRPFIEYEPSDEPWCRYFGIGHEVEDATQLVMFKMEEPRMATRFVQPATYLIGATAPDPEAIAQYLRDTRQSAFQEDWVAALSAGVNPGEALCSLYAKVCYASLVPGKNENIERTRSIHANVISTLDHGHGSVFEHCWVNFITTNCSRVFTHELVRHRVGTAFSQTSGRYVRTNNLQMVWDPILDPVKEEADDLLELIEMRYQRMVDKMLPLDKVPPEQRGDNVRYQFDHKKKVTSALRRFLPNGQVNEMGWSMNLRAARHLIMLRTSRHAEWEIRTVFAQVFEIMRHKYPLMFSDAQVAQVDGLPEVTGMRVQPYEPKGS